MRISLYGLRVLVDPVAVDGLDLGAFLLGAGLFASFFLCGVFALQGHEGIASSCRNGPGKLSCLIYYSLCLIHTAESVDDSVA